MTVNEEITAVNVNIAEIDNRIELLSDKRTGFIEGLSKSEDNLRRSKLTESKLINTDLPYCNNYKIKSKREACKRARNSELSAQKEWTSTHQASVDKYVKLIQDIQIKIDGEENTKVPLFQQLDVLKAKQGSINSERSTLADQGISLTGTLVAAELEGKAAIKAAEITATADADVAKKRGQALLDEEEAALQIKNDKSKVIMYVGIAIAAVVLIVGTIFLVKKLKKKKGAKKK